MRRSLSLISIVCCIYFCSCSQSKTTVKTDSSLVGTMHKDTVYTTDSSATGATDQSAVKDSVKGVNGSGTAIIHKGPEQEKLDSIKKAKLKGKK